MRFNSRDYIYRIRSFKIATKILIILIICVVSYNILKNDTYYEEPQTTDIKNTNSQNITINDSIFNGTDQNGKHYNIKSKSLLKQNDNLYYAQYVDGFYEIRDTDLQFVSLNGIINDKLNQFKLIHDVTLTYKNYILKTEELNVDTINDIASSSDGVSVLHLNSHINSNKLHLNMKTGIIEFHGNVTTYIKTSDFK